MNGPHRWPTAMSESDREAYRRSGFGNEIGIGSRPAVLVIDVQYRTVGPDVPILEAIDASYPMACGRRAWAAVEPITQVLAAARQRRLPVLHPCVAPKSPETVGAFGRVNPGVGDVDARGYEFLEEVAPVAGELAVPKLAASAFFGTPLTSYLVDRSVDSVILLGCTTSGCVRATAVDAFSLNLRTTVVADGVYDRAQLSHEVSLFELDAKYADVRTAADVLDQLDAL
jgi:maleamate amidohydrolase